MAIWDAILGGITGGVEERKASQATAQAERRKTDRASSLELLKGVIGGKIKPAPEGEATMYGPGQRQAPEGIGGRIAEGFGLKSPQYGQGQGYMRSPEALSDANKPTVKVVGNSLVRFDPTTGKAEPLYTAKGNKQIKEVGMTGRIIEYDPSTGNVRELYNEFGEPVFDQEPAPKPPQTQEKPIRTGILDGRKVGEFADGTTRYLDTGEAVE